jgi:hypothetical protein
MNYAYRIYTKTIYEIVDYNSQFTRDWTHTKGCYNMFYSEDGQPAIELKQPGINYKVAPDIFKKEFITGKLVNLLYGK